MYIEEATSWKNIRQNKEYKKRNKQKEKANYKGEN